MRALIATASMLGGAALVLTLIVALNAKVAKPAQGPEARATTMTIERQVKKPTVRPRPPPPPKAAPPKQAARAPAPMLSSALSGLDVGLGGLGTGALDATQRGVLQSASMNAGKDLVMTESAVDELPKPTSRLSVRYPPRAQADGITGEVMLSILVDVDGQVAKVKVLSAQPAGVFEEAAVEAIQAMRFQPATYQGKPVKVWVKQPIRFELG